MVGNKQLSVICCVVSEGVIFEVNISALQSCTAAVKHIVFPDRIA